MTSLTRSRNSVNPISPVHRDEISLLSRAIERQTASPKTPMLIGTDGEQVVLPSEIYEVLTIVVGEMIAGHAVTITPLSQRISTQEAADLLGISRPTLIKLLETSAIAYEQPSRHRRIKLSDVLDYRERTHSAAVSALDALTSDASAAGLYNTASEDYLDALARARSTKVQTNTQ